MAEPTLRRLRQYDQNEINQHFQRLDAEILIARFNGRVASSFVCEYAAGILAAGAHAYGAFPDGHLRGIGELRPITDGVPRACEMAFSVEPGWQNQGLGDALLSRLIAAAQNRGIRELHMVCLVSNQRMQALARKHDAELRLLPGQVEATLAAPWPTALSMTEEIAGEYQAFARAILRWPL